MFGKPIRSEKPAVEAATELAIRAVGSRFGNLLENLASGATISGAESVELRTLVDAGMLVPA